MIEQLKTIRHHLEPLKNNSGVRKALTALTQLEAMVGEPVADINVRPSESGGTIASVFSHKLPVGSWLLYRATPVAQQPRKRPRLTPEDIAAEDAAGGVFAAGALVAQQPQDDISDFLRSEREGWDHRDPQPQATTIAEAARDVGKWLNERPNRPIDLRHVAMLVAHAMQPQAEAVLPDVARDAARYQWLRSNQLLAKVHYLPRTTAESLDHAIDAAIAQQKGGV